MPMLTKMDGFYRMSGTSRPVSNVSERVESAAWVLAHHLVEKGWYTLNEVTYTELSDLTLWSVGRLFPDWREMLETTTSDRLRVYSVLKVAKHAFAAIEKNGPDVYFEGFRACSDELSERFVIDRRAQKDLDVRIAKKVYLVRYARIADFVGKSNPRGGKSRAERIAPYIRKRTFGCQCPSHG